MSGNILHKPLMMSDHVLTSGTGLDCLGPAQTSNQPQSLHVLYEEHISNPNPL